MDLFVNGIFAIDGGWCRVCRIEAPLVTCMGSELCCVCLCVELLRCLLCPHEVLGHGAVWQTECCFSSTLGELHECLCLSVSCHYSLWLWEQHLRYHSERWVCPTTYTGPPPGRQTPGPLRWARSKAADPLAAVLMAHRVLHRYVLWVYEGNCFLPFCYGVAVFVKTTHNPP